MTPAATVHNNATKVVRFDGSVDWEEEDRRTARGFQLRRERKERKWTAYCNRQNKIEATVDIIHQPRRSTSLVALARRERRVRGVLKIILSEFVPEDDDIATRLTAFRNMSLNSILDSLSEYTECFILALFSFPAFFNTFRAYFPSIVVTTSSSDDDDSPRSRRRRRRQRWRQSGENVVNKRQRRQNL